MNTTLSFPARTSAQQKQRWGQLHGAGLPLAIANYFAMQTAGVMLIITPNNLITHQLAEEISFFLEDATHQDNVFVFPDWETLPYDTFSPHQDIISERLTTLYRLLFCKQAIVIGSISTLMHQLCPVSYIQQRAFVLEEGQSFDRNQCIAQLLQSGYYAVNQVLEHGEYAVRGAIIDLFPMGSPQPLRIELFDETIDSLRFFEPESQRTIKKISHIQILPAREFPIDDDSVAHFRRAFRECFSGKPTLCPLYEAISNKQYPSGIEYYLSLFYEQTASLLDYLPAESQVLFIEDIADKAEQFWGDVGQRFEQSRHDHTRPLLDPERVFFKPESFLGQTKKFRRIYLQKAPLETQKANYNFAVHLAPRLPVERKKSNPIENLQNYLTQAHKRFLIVVESAGRREAILDMLQQQGISCHICQSWRDFLTNQFAVNVVIGPLSAGAELLDANWMIITESQLFGETSVPQQRRSTTKIQDPNLIIRDLIELKMGDPVVHLQFGVGRYDGLQAIERHDTVSEFLVLRYAGEDKIYVPVTSLHLISKYTGADGNHAPLHKLGTDQWAKEKRKAVEKIHDVAAELLEVYAQREARPGIAFECNSPEYQQFAADFPFTETTDQTNAIAAIMQDMQSSRPMDRLICGDVGFGKTEVAMRAAFIAVHNHRQVCVLVPTTLLAAQHFETFRDRFADFPVRIELLSRFRSAKEISQSIEATQQGLVDILIGTHKLFSEAIQFKQLGLLIIDEEHRFGVKQKEHIKQLRSHIDILSMTATPIPRTLNMAMTGIRDISLIATPPAKRLAIKTFWHEKNSFLVREAMMREIMRGGQVFYLHNDVQTIDRVCQDIQTLVPEAKIQRAHGQMRERELEKIMSDFYHHHFNVLVCTTIIETGIDIPTANTIIIDRADKFGLAQLHQLRGRVGRSHHQAYAYLFTPPQKALTADAIKRLEAIVSFEDLGAGFTLALQDMEIRGAGELLGEGQSGNMHALGFSLFMEILEKAVSDLQQGKTPEMALPLQTGTEIDVGVSAIIPDDYVHDVHARLVLYKRISHAKDNAQLRELQVEMIDRFGLLPDSVKRLMRITELKLLATPMGVRKVTVCDQLAKIDFDEQPKINVDILLRLIQLHAKRYQMQGSSRLCCQLESATAELAIQEISQLLQQLGQNA